LITKVFTRKRLKVRKQQVPKSEPDFCAIEQNFSPQVNSGAGVKHNATPISVESLRRSKRIDVVNKGFRHVSPSTNINKPKGKKKPLKTPPSAGKEMKFIIPSRSFQTFQQLINISLLV
jgi:hypothetical protein